MPRLPRHFMKKCEKTKTSKHNFSNVKLISTLKFVMVIQHKTYLSGFFNLSHWFRLH